MLISQTLKTKKNINFSNVKIVILDFDGVLTDNYVYINQLGVETVRCYRSDGIGISNLKKLGVKFFIVSTESNIVVKERAKKLKIDCYYNVGDKDKVVREISINTKINLENILFIGNDINDIPALKIVGFPCAVNDCFYEIEKHVVFKTNKSGGLGAVRELCDLIYNQKSNAK